MALQALRSRRLLPVSSALISRHFASSSVASRHSSLAELPTLMPTQTPVVHFQSRSFKSTPVSFLSSRSMNRNDRDEEKLDPDAILFEGCDYNHWLITMEFPKDPKPTPEEMVETYVQTCAKGLNISVEEAKKKIYACSTTTYQGFQAVMTEAESEKFEGLPGVVFVLPDSYIDPVNKEYGGDKYINGTIIPRPPPIQYNRGRIDRNKPRYDNQRPPPQGNFNNQQGHMQGDGRNYGSPQNIPQQNYGSPGQVPPPPPPPVGNRFEERGGNLNQPGQGNYYPQDRRGSPPGEFGDHRSYAPPAGIQNFGPGPNQNFGPGGGGGYGAGARGERGPGQGFGPSVGGSYGSGGRPEQGPGHGFGPGVGGSYASGGRPEQVPGHGLGPVGGYGRGPRGEQEPGQGFGPSVGGGYVPGPKGEQGLGQGFGPGMGGGYGARRDQGPGQDFAPGGQVSERSFGPTRRWRFWSRKSGKVTEKQSHVVVKRLHRKDLCN